MMPALIIGFVIFGIAGWIWRLNIILNHPEKEQRLREATEHIKKEQAEVFGALTNGARKGIAAALKLRRRLK
jgi:hypothetical protein